MQRLQNNVTKIYKNTYIAQLFGQSTMPIMMVLPYNIGILTCFVIPNYGSPKPIWLGDAAAIAGHESINMTNIIPPPTRSAQRLAEEIKNRLGKWFITAI